MKLLECERLSFFWWTVGRNRLPIESNPLRMKTHLEKNRIKIKENAC